MVEVILVDRNAGDAGAEAGGAVVLTVVAVETGAPEALFPTRIAGGVANVFRPQYAVSRDGRFLINQLAEESATVPITLILNWASPVR